MNEARDLAIAVVVAVFLLVGLISLPQCSVAPTRTAHDADAEASVSSSAVENEHGEASGTRKSIHDVAEEEEREEGENIKNIAHALQTIGANPELRRTYGFKE